MMLTNTKIFVRLAVLVGTLLALMTAVAIVGIVGLSDMKQGLETVYLDRVVPLKDLARITDTYYRVRILVIESVNASDAAAVTKNKSSVDELLAQTRDSWTGYLNSDLTPDEKEMLRNLVAQAGG